MKKIIFSFVFLIICLFGFNFNVNAYSNTQVTYITSAGWSYSNYFNNTYNPATNDLTSISYYESFFNYLKTGLTFNNANENISNWANNRITDFADYPYIIVGHSTSNFNNSSSTNKYLFWFSKNAPFNNNNVNFRSRQPDILYTWLELDSSNNVTWVQSTYYYGIGNSYASVYGSNYYITNNLESIMSTLTYDLISTTISYDPDMQISGWTKHCLSGQDTFFSVIPNTIDTTNHDIIDDFILFPYTIRNYGINWLQYDTITNTNLYDISYDTEFLYQYILNPYEEMQELADTYYMQLFNSKYSGLYNSLYGYNIFLNRYQYTTDNKYNIQVFRFNDTYTERPFCSVVGGSSYCEDENGNIHGGGGRSHDELINEPQYDNNICFYIPNTFTLKVWNVNDYNDIDDTLSIGGNNYDINTDSYELGYNYYINDTTYSGYAGYFKSLINACKIPLDFISSKITLFFDKLPPLIQYSIISGVFILIVIGLIKFLTGGK